MFWAIDHLIETKTESTDGEQLVSPSRDDGGDEVHSGIYFVFTVKILRETEFSKQYKCDPIFINDFNLNHKIQETIKSTSVKSPNSNRSFNPELMKCISETKSKFAETLISLDLAERCLQCPSEKTAEQLKLLFDRGKCTCKDTCKTLKKFYTLLIRFTEGENENAEYKDYENNKNDKGGKDDSDYHLDCECQPRSISAESLRKGTAKQEKLCTVSKILPYQDEEPVTKIKKGTAGKMWREKNSEQEHASLKWRGLNQKSHSETRIELLEQEISCLEELLQDVLADLGELTVEKTARESEGRKFELFHRIFRSSSPEAKRSVVSGINDKPDTEDGRLGYLNSSRTNGNGSPTGFPKAQRTNESVNSPVNGSTGEQRVQGAESLVPGSNHQEEKEANETCSNTGISVFGTNSENQNPTMQNSSKSVEKTSGGEGIDTPGNINGTSDAASTSRDESGEQSLTQRSNEDLLFSIQQDDSNGRECISLGNIPPTSVATTLYNNYKLLLLSLGQSLLSSDVVKLKDWASQGFAIANVQSATDVLLQLDQKGIINASNLSPLRDFFESVVRIDLVYIIDAFLLGDYSLLRQTPTWKKREASRAQNPQHGSTSRFSSLLNTLSSSTSTGRNVAASGSLQMSASRNPATSRKPENSNGPQNSVAQQNHQHALSGFLGYPNTNNANLVSRSPNENQSRAHEQRNEKPIASGFTETSVVVADGPVTNERRTAASNSSTRTNPPVKNNGSRITIGSNGSKLSKFSREGAEPNIVSFAHAPNPSRNQDLDLESNWLCSHYKRLCYVKFKCCDNFWPCHRCHNNQSTCGRKKLKSRDTQMVKCVYCNKEQQFGQFCCDCGAKFASYFCGLCQHLTGNDDHPYHCQKCGICRIHGDRSFHCDVCGVCLDVQLRGNHKCREGSAHDECCICLEDAFTGCQILPCSHKVHKECATQMIRSGITRCPICRESFAHKLERRPLPNSRKRSGKS